MPQTKALGITQSDILIRSAIIEGIEDLRRNAWLLDYVFASLKEDCLTNSDYGQKEIDNAKKWVLQTEIPVFLNVKQDSTTFPAISIKLVSSNEEDNTLGDVHYEPSELSDGPVISWPSLTDVFTPVGYDPITGILTIPQNIADQIITTTGQVLVDKNNNQYEILEVINSVTFKIKTDINADLTDSVIKGLNPGFATSLESATFSETYSIGCHVNSEPVFLTYLHSIVCFILLRYRQSLLELRGFANTSIKSSDFARNEAFENELVYSRFIQISGLVRNYWPKDIGQRITGTYVQPRILGGGIMAPGTEDDAPWLGDLDQFGKLFK